MYQPYYRSSWALVIGINLYQHASPLSYACEDADAVAAMLTDELGFPEDQVILLKDSAATKQAILEEFQDHIDKANHPDDRVLVFYAGHGTTVTGLTGPTGFLIPVDGDPTRRSTLIRWDDLTRDADLMTAKHILFVMDACYSGLALKRAVPPGTQRFLSDMLQRPSRQVITAGKADEVVADGGGPDGRNSIFTGYLIEGLRGTAADENGVLTANGLMAYVYRAVAQDNRSNQTPHYGHIFGDGDFILRPPEGSSIVHELGADLVTVSVSETPESLPASLQVETPSFAIRNGYGDPSHPNFGRNDWSARLAEPRYDQSRDSEFSRAYSWLSLIVEPVSDQVVELDPERQAERLRSYKPQRAEPFEQFMLPTGLLTTSSAILMYDPIAYGSGLWGQYLRVDRRGNIEYADTQHAFFEWNGARLFRYVQIVGSVWQFVHFTSHLLKDAGYSMGVRLLVNLVGTRDTFLDDFSKEPGENNQKWRGVTDPIHGLAQDWKCHEANLQMDYLFSVQTIDEAKSRELVNDVAKRLGLAYNHQSQPRCFNYNTDIFPWNQYLNRRR